MAHRAVLHYGDLETFPNDKVRREILGGELNVTPSPMRRHQRIVGIIFRLLSNYAERAGGEAYVSPFDVVLSAQNVVIPDVLYVASDRLHTVDEKAVFGVPSLFVEVLSPATHHIDCGKKREIYARFGLPEYWIVDPDARTIERCSDPAGGRYRSIEVFDRDMPAATLVDLTLSFEDVFA